MPKSRLSLDKKNTLTTQIYTNEYLEQQSRKQQQQQVLHYSISERDIKQLQFQDKQSLIKTPERYIHQNRHYNDQQQLSYSAGQPHTSQYKLVNQNIKLCPNNDINYDIYNKEILSLIRNQNFCEFRFKNTPFEEKALQQRKDEHYKNQNSSLIRAHHNQQQRHSLIQHKINSYQNEAKSIFMSHIENQNNKQDHEIYNMHQNQLNQNYAKKIHTFNRNQNQEIIGSKNVRVKNVQLVKNFGQSHAQQVMQSANKNQRVGSYVYMVNQHLQKSQTYDSDKLNEKQSNQLNQRNQQQQYNLRENSLNRNFNKYQHHTPQKFSSPLQNMQQLQNQIIQLNGLKSNIYEEAGMRFSQNIQHRKQLSRINIKGIQINSQLTRQPQTSSQSQSDINRQNSSNQKRTSTANHQSSNKYLRYSNRQQLQDTNAIPNSGLQITHNKTNKTQDLVNLNNPQTSYKDNISSNTVSVPTSANTAVNSENKSGVIKQIEIKPKSSLLQSRMSKKNSKEKKGNGQAKNQHYDHIINQVIRYSNDFIVETFIRPNDQPANIEKIKSICNFFGFKLPKNIIADVQQVKSKDFQIFSKEKILQHLYLTLNASNQADLTQIQQQQAQQTRKFHIGRGNNYQLVRSIFKQRWWWQINQDGEEFETANFIWTSWRKNELLNSLKPSGDATNQQSHQHWEDGKMRIYSKLEDNFHLSNKKALFFNMTQYYKLIGKEPFEFLPLTFHIEHGIEDPEYEKFKQYFNQIEQDKIDKKRLLEEKKRKYAQEHPDDEYDSEEEVDEEQFYGVKIPKNIWIMKPGENSNRGTGIFVCNTIREIQLEINSAAKKAHTHIIQKYIERPLLIHNRKFDIRVFGMMTSINGSMKGYFYEDGYIRTSCKEFSLDNLQNRFIHLTNDAVQKKSDDYGKFENGNKLSYQNFQKYLDTNMPLENINFHKQILPQIRDIISDTFKATFMKIDPHRRVSSFEIFGYDFMIDDDFRVYLIEANTNPCLELSCPLLARIIPAMLDSAFRLSVDPLFPPPDFNMARKNTLHEIMPINKFELVFDESIEGQKLREILKYQEIMTLKIDQNDEFEEESNTSQNNDAASNDGGNDHDIVQIEDTGLEFNDEE